MSEADATKLLERIEAAKTKLINVNTVLSTELKSSLRLRGLGLGFRRA